MVVVAGEVVVLLLLLLLLMMMMMMMMMMRVRGLLSGPLCVVVLVAEGHHLRRHHHRHADRILSSVEPTSAFSLLSEPGKRRIALVSMRPSKFVLIQPEIKCLPEGHNAEYTSV